MNEQEFNTTLHKFRDEMIVHPLVFRPSIARLLDSGHCQQLRNAFNVRSDWERRKALPTLGPSLPDVRGVYMFVWCPNLLLPFAEGGLERTFWILYVGKAGQDGGTSDTIRARYISEYGGLVGGDVGALWDKDSPEGREQRLARYLVLRPLEYWFLPLDNPRDVQLLERKLIRMLAPPLNKQLTGPRLKAGVPVPAFEENP